MKIEEYNLILSIITLILIIIFIIILANGYRNGQFGTNSGAKNNFECAVSNVINGANANNKCPLNSNTICNTYKCNNYHCESSLCRTANYTKNNLPYPCNNNNYFIYSDNVYFCQDGRILPINGVCPAGMAKNNGSCYICPTNKILVNSQCVSCPINNIIINNQCTPCLTNQVAVNNQCISCTKNQIFQNNQCITCPSDKVKYKNQCVSCDTNKIAVDGNCIPCTSLQIASNNQCKQCSSMYGDVGAYTCQMLFSGQAVVSQFENEQYEDMGGMPMGMPY